MKLHERAATCPRCRMLIVRRVLIGTSIASTAREFDVSVATVRKWLRRYRQAGPEGLTDRSCRPRHSPTRKLQPGAILNDAIMEIVHSPPSSAGINRTSWRLRDIKNMLEARGLLAGDRSIRTAIQAAGLRWKKARVSSTSHDPEYRSKVDAIKSVLASLSADDAFFSIDELGPVAVKMRGGRALQRSDVTRSVPQWQPSKGSFILTAALDLARNQVAAFFSERKNADEVIRLIELLRELYAKYRRLYVSWDAAPWHRADRLMQHVDSANARAAQGDGPAVTLTTLFVVSTALGLGQGKQSDASDTSMGAKSRDGRHDFDWDIGTWKTHQKRLLRPLTGSSTWVEYHGTDVVRKIWDGANIGEIEADTG